MNQYFRVHALTCLNDQQLPESGESVYSMSINVTVPDHISYNPVSTCSKAVQSRALSTNPMLRNNPSPQILYEKNVSSSPYLIADQ
jgi:hypothetical protein